MCLIVDKKYPKPENGSIRYKVLTKTSLHDYRSPTFPTNFSWRIGETQKLSFWTRFKRALVMYDENGQGFHVFVNEEDAKRYRMYTVDVVVKCRCKGFVAGGTIDDVCKKTSEIWREVTILEEV